MATLNLLAPLFRNLAQNRAGVHFLVAGPAPVRRALADLALALISPDGEDNERLAGLNDWPGQAPFNGAQIVPADLEPNNFTVTLAWVDDAESAAFVTEGLRNSRKLGRAVIVVTTPEVLDHPDLADFRTDDNVTLVVG